jgi:hypothetical protein
MIGLALVYKLLAAGLVFAGLTIGGFVLSSKNDSITYTSEIPPIDIAPPVQIETATFGLG